MKFWQTCGKALVIKLLRARDPSATGASVILHGRMSSSVQLLLVAGGWESRCHFTESGILCLRFTKPLPEFYVSLAESC